MKRICAIVIVFVFCLVMPAFAQVRKKYYVKLMPHDYSNWVWDELKDVKSCEKTADGLQYVIVYKGVAAPRAIRPAIGNSKEPLPVTTITMTVGVDNVMILEYEE